MDLVFSGPVARARCLTSRQGRARKRRRCHPGNTQGAEPHELPTPETQKDPPAEADGRLEMIWED